MSPGRELSRFNPVQTPFARFSRSPAGAAPLSRRSGIFFPAPTLGIWLGFPTPERFDILGDLGGVGLVGGIGCL